MSVMNQILEQSFRLFMHKIGEFLFDSFSNPDQTLKVNQGLDKEIDMITIAFKDGSCIDLWVDQEG